MRKRRGRKCQEEKKRKKCQQEDKRKMGIK
jgi:hypothetical protein